MAQTYYTSMTLEEAVGSNETIPTPYSSGNAFFGVEHGAALAIFNQRESDSVVKVRDISLRDRETRSTGLPSQMDVYRITAASGSEVITPVAMDSTATALPSQVKCYRYPTITTTGQPLQRMLAAPNNSPTVALRGLRALSGSYKLGFTGYLYNSFNADVQTYTFRAGEGLALNSTTILNGRNYSVEVVFSDGTNTWMAEIPFITKAIPSFALMNEAGSSVVLYVRTITIRETRADDLLKKLRLFTVSNLYGGNDMSIIKMDSANDTMPAGVLVRKNGAVFQVPPDSHYTTSGKSEKSGDVFGLRGTVLTASGVYPNTLGLAAMSNVARPLFASTSLFTNEIVLREGEGLALLLHPLLSGLGDFEISVLFTVDYTAPGGGGGETSHVF